MGFFQLFLYTFSGPFVSRDVNWKRCHFHAKRWNVYFKNTQGLCYSITCWILDARLAFLGRWMGIWKGPCQRNWALQLLLLAKALLHAPLFCLLSMKERYVIKQKVCSLGACVGIFSWFMYHFQAFPCAPSPKQGNETLCKSRGKQNEQNSDEFSLQFKVFFPVAML